MCWGQGHWGLRGGSGLAEGQGRVTSTCLGHFLTLSRGPGGAPAVPASPTQHLVGGPAWWRGGYGPRPWRSPYKAMGLGARHAWVRGGHDARAVRWRAQLPSSPLPGGSPSQPITQPRSPLYKARAASPSFGSVSPPGYRQPLPANAQPGTARGRVQSGVSSMGARV